MELFKRIREKSGRTKSEMARLVGVLPTNWRKVEETEWRIDLRKLIRIWRVSGMSGNQFLAELEKEVEGKK